MPSASGRCSPPLQGPLRRWSDRLHELAPRLMEMNLFALGSPVAEICHVGLAPRAAAMGRGDVLGRLVEGAREAAEARGGALGGRRVSPAGSNGLVSSIVVACNVLKMLFLAMGWLGWEARLKLDMMAVARRRESFSCEG